MNQRVKQFFRAITAKLGEEDHAFIGRYLSPDEAELFFGMHVADQYHALKVAYTAGDFASEGNLQVDQDLLIRGALLHDIGRKKGDLDILGKVFSVLMDAVFPYTSRKLACEGNKGPFGRLRHMMFVYYNHPKIGADILRGKGLRREAEMAEKHHMPEAVDDSWELRLLRRADELN